MRCYLFLGLRWTLITLLSAGIASCMVGPNFHSPNAPKTNGYTKKPLPEKTASTSGLGSAGRAQQLVMGKDIPGEWWTLFHSKGLNELIETGLNNSPTLEAAEATLKQAQENLRAQFGNLLLPNVNASLGGERLRFSGTSIDFNIPPSIFNVFTASVNVTYTLDVFGGYRRQLEGLQAQVDYQRYELIAAYLTLTSNIAATAVNIASLEGQIKATHQLINAEQGQLTILKKQLQLGGISAQNVLTQQTLVAQTQATLPPLEKSLAEARDSLSVLVGELPSNSVLPTIDLNQLTLPATIPLSLPSALVRQRPDVQASEALLHQASAQVGVATANLFPQFPLSASYAWQATSPNQLFKPMSNIWNYGGNIVAPIFNGGALMAERRAAIDAFDAAYAQYKQTVLSAFQNVADSLTAIEQDALALKEQRIAEIAAYKNVRIATEQYRLGGVSYLSLLTAQQQYQQTLINRIQAEAARYSDTVALFQSLGGGWWNMKDWRTTT